MNERGCSSSSIQTVSRSECWVHAGNVIPSQMTISELQQLLRNTPTPGVRFTSPETMNSSSSLCGLLKAVISHPEKTNYRASFCKSCATLEYRVKSICYVLY